MRLFFRLTGSALAAILALITAPVHAEAITLLCQQDSGGSFRLRVDYDRNSIELLNSDGSAQFSAPARITESHVRWNVTGPNMGTHKFEGELDRGTGAGWVFTPPDNPNLMKPRHMNGMCRRATQKF